jgi:hypothetical protein
MPTLVSNLVIDRVDFVDEGANSEAFIELYKRKENGTTMDFNEVLGNLKPEEASVIKAKFDAMQSDLDTANENLEVTKGKLAATEASLSAVNEELNVFKAKECAGEGEGEGAGEGEGEDANKSVAGMDEEEVIKSMPEAARELFNTLKAQKEAAEEEVRKNNEKAAHLEAVNKAASLKALPVKQDELVEVIKRCDEGMLDMLTAINAAIENTVLEEVGKNKGNGASDTGTDAWSTIEKKADEIAKRDGISTAKAITLVIKENPELYKEYLNGGAN